VTALARRLARKRVVICTGAGGVGKTTVSVAVALGLAAQGQRVAVVTVDPARRLAEALGLRELGNTPRLVDPRRFSGTGLEIRGELWAMMLDVQRTFDDLIVRLTPDTHSRDEILANPVYRHISTAAAGSQEYSAIAKLFEIEHEGGYDVIVLDTPPSRNALDFLDAPERLTAFLEGRALAVFLAPTRGAARAAGIVLAALRRVTGFRERAVDVRALLTDPATAFLVITAPERGAVDETIFFAAQLKAATMHRAGVIVNRVHPLDDRGSDIAATTARLRSTLGEPLAGRVARAHADVQLLARRDGAAVEHLCRALPRAPARLQSTRPPRSVRCPMRRRRRCGTCLCAPAPRASRHDA